MRERYVPRKSDKETSATHCHIPEAGNTRPYLECLHRGKGELVGTVLQGRGKAKGGTVQRREDTCVVRHMRSFLAQQQPFHHLRTRAAPPISPRHKPTTLLLLPPPLATHSMLPIPP